MYNPNMGPTYLQIQDGFPPVQPSFPVSPTMQYAIGYVGSEIVKVLQMESQKNLPRNACYNLVSQNQYGNQEYQFLYQLAAACIEYTALQQRQDPRNLVSAIVPEVVKAFTAYIWFKYYQQTPVPPDINGFLQTYIQAHNQNVAILQQISHQTPHQNVNYGTYNRVVSPQTVTPQVIHQPYHNPGFPQHHQYQPSGSRFLSQPANATNQYTQPNPIHTSGSRFHTPMASQEVESRFSPKQEEWKGPNVQEYRFNGHNKQVEYMENAMAKQVAHDVQKLTQEQSQTLFGINPTTTVDLSQEVVDYSEESLTTQGKYKGYVDAPPEWYPTESQRFWIIYNPVEFTCEVRINAKGHPVQKFIQREEEMKETDHIYADLDINGPKPTIEDLHLAEQLERQFGLSDEQREAQRRKAIEDGRKPTHIPVILEEEESHDSLNQYFISLQKKAIIKETDMLTHYGSLITTTVNKHSPDDWVNMLFECKTLSGVVSALTEVKNREDTRSYMQMVNIYTDMVNDVLHDRMSLSISFDDLLLDYQDLKEWLEKEEVYDIFDREMTLAIRKLHHSDNLSIVNEKDYTILHVNIPVSVTTINSHSKVLGLPQDSKKCMSDELTSPMLKGFGEFLYSRQTPIYHFFETLDGVRYKLTRSGFNKEAYFIEKVNHE